MSCRAWDRSMRRAKVAASHGAVENRGCMVQRTARVVDIMRAWRRRWWMDLGIGLERQVNCLVSTVGTLNIGSEIST